MRKKINQVHPNEINKVQAAEVDAEVKGMDKVEVDVAVEFKAHTLLT